MANSRIAGITVEIGGDTTKLSAALKNVNTEIRSTQSQLKDVNEPGGRGARSKMNRESQRSSHH